MSEYLAQRRKGMAATPKAEAETKVKPAEKAFEEVEVDLEGRVLELINRHPEGVKVGDMEEPLGVDRKRLGPNSQETNRGRQGQKRGETIFSAVRE